MVVFNDPVPVENPALQAVLMALEMREAIGALTEKWRRLGHEIGFGIGIAHGFATLGTIGFEGRFDYAAIGTVTAGTIFCAPNDPPACPAWGWGRVRPASSRRQPPSVLRVRADCGGRLFTAKLGVVVHDLAHQLLDHLLADKTLLDGCKGLRTRSLKPRPVAVSSRPTVTPLSVRNSCIRRKFDASVTIRPLIATPAQGVSPI